ncbi:MAG: SH3 domain-containing protein [Lachnospiraceae bacterium]|jgi:hypothetical protein
MDNENKPIMETEPFDYKEDNSDMKMKLNRSNDDNKKKIIMYVVIGVVVLILILVMIYIVLGNKKNNTTDNKKNDIDIVNKDEDKDKDTNKSNMGYVSCDDNTSLLNVRNSTSGDIIDGLSCYKEVTIEEELPGTDNCKKWYKVSYVKRGSNYTGYACGTYIKVEDIDKNTIKTAKEVIDKANNYYDNSVLKAYCGENPGETKTIEYNENGNSFKGYYVKSEYKNLEELKKHLLTFLDESLIKTELKLSDINNKRMYDDYYEIDGNLYCRNYSGKGRLTRYTGNYDIEIINSRDSRISGNIVYEYLTEESSCDVKNLSKCNNSNFKYELGKFNIDKVDNNYVVTKIDFHE